MGRRALRKIDATLDLSRHLIEFDALEQPWNPAAIFSRAAPLEIEIGSGKGLFLAGAAAAAPERDFIGIEVAGKYARFAAARLARRGLTNARLIHGDARRLFVELLPAATLAAVHVYFPDPWWKARHRKRRVMNAMLAGHIERTLLPGGALHFWSDVEEYFQTTVEILANETRLIGPLPVVEQPALDDLDYRTHFERRMRLHHQPVYRAEFRKPAGNQPS
jgi:tRNA (guanine-N7-)-methyltransferase